MRPDNDALEGNRMRETDVDELLLEVGWGVVSMAHDGRPYSLPLSFGYEPPSAIYFVFAGASDEGRKVRYAESTAAAGLLVVDIEGPSDWRSAYVEGPLERVHAEEWDAAREALADNGWHPQLYTNVEKGTDPRVWKLAVDEKNGRRVGSPGG
jgi:hypothetical protein